MTAGERKRREAALQAVKDAADTGGWCARCGGSLRHKAPVRGCVCGAVAASCATRLWREAAWWGLWLQPCWATCDLPPPTLPLRVSTHHPPALLSSALPDCPAAFPTATRRAVQAFGSFAHSVSLPGADLDIVVSGIMTPISRGGGELFSVFFLEGGGGQPGT